MSQSTEIIVKIRFLLSSMTKTEKKIAELILANPECVRDVSLEEFAARMRCSDASILRFCRKLNLNGYLELRQLLAGAQPETVVVPVSGDEITKTDNAYEIFKKVIRNYQTSLEQTLALYNDDFEKALEAFKKARCISFFGVGDAWPVCEYAQFKLQRIGVRSNAYSDVALALATASLMTEEDVAVGISFSGETKLVVDSLKIAKRNGATTICLVHFDKCNLTKYADYKIFTATQDYTVGNDLVARRTPEFAIIDTLYSGLVVSREEHAEQAKKSLNAIMTYK